MLINLVDNGSNRMWIWRAIAQFTCLKLSDMQSNCTSLTIYQRILPPFLAIKISNRRSFSQILAPLLSHIIWCFNSEVKESRLAKLLPGNKLKREVQFWYIQVRREQKNHFISKRYRDYLKVSDGSLRTVKYVKTIPDLRYYCFFYA